MVFSFTTYLQKAVKILFIVKLVFDAIGPDSIVGIVGCYCTALSDVTIVLTRDVTIVLTLMHDDVNNASPGQQ